MRNPEDAYKSKPDVAMPLFERHVEGDSQAVLREAGSKREIGYPPSIAHARRNDRETSKQAAASVTNGGRTRDAILKVLRLYGPQTDEGIAAALRDRKFSPSGLRSRRAELVDMGLVVDSGKIGKTVSARATIIWRLAK